MQKIYVHAKQQIKVQDEINELQIDSDCVCSFIDEADVISNSNSLFI